MNEEEKEELEAAAAVHEKLPWPRHVCVTGPEPQPQVLHCELKMPLWFQQVIACLCKQSDCH